MQKSWLLITYQWNYLIEISRFLSNCLSKHKMKKKNWINFSVKVISIKTLQHTETPQWSCASNHLSGYCMRHDFSNLIRYLELFKQYTFTFVCSNKANLTVRFACSKRPIWQPFHDGGHYHIETSPFICWANQLTGFYIIPVSVMKGLNETERNPWRIPP